MTASGDLLVELGALTLLTADGVRVLLDSDAKLRSVGGSLRVCNPAGVVARVVDLTPLRDGSRPERSGDVRQLGRLPTLSP